MGRFRKGRIPWNKGKKGLQTSWNKGLTRETDKRVQLSAVKGSMTIKSQYDNGRVAPMKNKPNLKIRQEKHWNWKGGKFIFNISRQEWDKIRYEVYKRDKFTCQHCFKNKICLDVHHIILYRASKSHDLAILISFCRKCHIKFERKMTTLYRQSAGKITEDFVGKILRDYTLDNSRLERIKDIVRTATINKIAEVNRNGYPPIENNKKISTRL